VKSPCCGLELTRRKTLLPWGHEMRWQCPCGADCFTKDGKTITYDQFVQSKK
jgi:hypothetical protein